VAYSPLGRGFLTDEAATRRDAEGDFRSRQPRFTGDALEHNLVLVTNLEAIAREKGVTVAQLALAWVLSRGEDVVPIPGTKRRRWLRENIAATSITLSDEDVAALEAAVPRGAVEGERYHAQGMLNVNG
jgi:aryl-alcohol dehydrogenase-like predicted oxidoreductase